MSFTHCLVSPHQRGRGCKASLRSVWKALALNVLHGFANSPARWGFDALLEIYSLYWQIIVWWLEVLCLKSVHFLHFSKWLHTNRKNTAISFLFFFFKLHFGKTIYFQNKTIMTKSEKRYQSDCYPPCVWSFCLLFVWLCWRLLLK